jgi:hypothetical protein
MMTPITTAKGPTVKVNGNCAIPEVRPEYPLATWK